MQRILKKNKGIGDAGSTADIRILWSAIVYLAGVYLLRYLGIFKLIKKLPFLADFIKNEVHFIKNLILTILLTNHRPARPNTKLFNNLSAGKHMS